MDEFYIHPVTGEAYGGDRQQRGFDDKGDPILDEIAPPKPNDGKQYKLVNRVWVEVVQPLPKRLEAILGMAAGAIAGNPNPSDELLELAEKISAIDNTLTSIANRFGGETAFYSVKAKQLIESLGELPAPELEAARQALLAEIEK